MECITWVKLRPKLFFFLLLRKANKHMVDSSVMRVINFWLCSGLWHKNNNTNTHINIKKVNRIAHCISFTGKIRKTSPFSIYNKSVSVNSWWEYQQKRIIFPRFLHGFSATCINEQSQDRSLKLQFCLSWLKISNNLRN